MSIFGKIFRRITGRDNQQSAATSQTNEELLSFEKDINDLLSQDKYIARSDFRNFAEYYSNLNNQFTTLKNTGTLNYFCKTNNISIDRVNDFMDLLAELTNGNDSSAIQSHNEEYITQHLYSEKKYLDNILKNVDPNINLDEEQRKVVLSDEDYTLVIAGAGAGKTTTMKRQSKISD